MNETLRTVIIAFIVVWLYNNYSKEGFDYRRYASLPGSNNIVLTDGNGNLSSIQFPKGMIMIWTEGLNNIPEGWALCDGNNGTPNLTGKFLLGVNQTSDVSAFRTLKATGGSTKISVNQLPSHSHNVGFMALGVQPGIAGGLVDSVGTWNPNSPIVSKSTGEGQDYYPPFVTVAYIMKL
jgi:hypothetical protein